MNDPGYVSGRVEKSCSFSQTGRPRKRPIGAMPQVEMCFGAQVRARRRIRAAGWSSWLGDQNDGAKLVLIAAPVHPSLIRVGESTDRTNARTKSAEVGQSDASFSRCACAAVSAIMIDRCELAGPATASGRCNRREFEGWRNAGGDSDRSSLAAQKSEL